MSKTHFITLRDGFVGFAMPSKVYGCIASRRPILYVGSRDSDVHLLCSQSGSFYQRVDVGDAAGVADALAAIGDLRVSTDEPRVAEATRKAAAATESV